MTGQSSKDATSIWLAVERVGLPDKKYFKIGEVAALVGVEPHVLRYWQTQFPQVRPQKSRSGHRLYRRKDVETLLLVRELLHVQRFTIAGARQALRGLVKSDRATTGLPAPADEEASPRALVRPYAEPPRAAATEVALLEVEGLDGEDLEDALSRELTEARAAGDITAIDVEAEEDPEDTGALATHAAAALSARPGADANDAPRAPSLAAGSSSLSAGSSSLSAAASSLSAAASSLPATSASLAASSLLAPSSGGAPEGPLRTATSARERARKEQLGFGFIPSNRGALEAARAEVLGVLDFLDREDAAANRLRARPVAAKT